MKQIVFILILLIPAYLISVTRTVSLDGAQQYTSIQSAVDACANGDSVLVYRGRYIENINLNNHNITLASLYARNPAQGYIEQTIIDGNLGNCIMIENGESVTINGFTFINNEQHLNTYIEQLGGVVAYYDAHLSILNCIIRDCSAANGGGGINVLPGADIYLSNVMIYNNHADIYGGGMYYEGDSIIFDPEHPSSIYNNFASQGMDVYVGYLHPETNPINIELNQCSLDLDAPDNYFITVHNAIVNVNIAEAFLTQIDSDLYVSPEGNDNNSGLSADAPMKTIAYAMQRIASNPDNPHTVHLAEGIYSHSANGQLFPVGAKSHVKIIGAGTSSTIMDGDMLRGFFGSKYINDAEIGHIAMRNCRSYLTVPLFISYSTNLNLHDLDFRNNKGSDTSGILLVKCYEVMLNNIYVGDITSEESISSLWLNHCDNVVIGNFVTTNLHITDPDSNSLGVRMDESDVVFRNSIFANNSGYDVELFAYQTVYAPQADRNLEMSNMLFVNNSFGQPSWTFSPIYIQSRFQTAKISNCTIAGNQGLSTLTDIFAGADIRNIISYNPGCPAEMYLKNHIYDENSHQYMDSEVNVSNSLFRTNSINSLLPDLVTYTDNIMGGNPLFLGSVSDSLDVSDPGYYHLSEGSPCINTGVADTTGMNLPDTDLAGNPRVLDDRIDMGCYEYGYVGNDDDTLPFANDRIVLSTYPNPISLSGNKGSYVFIEFTLPSVPKSIPQIEIYNVKGQRVRSIKISDSYNSMLSKAGLSKQADNKGEFYSTIWDGKDEHNSKVGTGLYIVRVKADGRQTIRKMMVVK